MWSLTIFSVAFLFSSTSGARILGVFMTPSYSHQIFFQPIWKELSLRGHQVTVYTPSPLNDPNLTNLTEYDLGFSFKYIESLTDAAYDFKKIFALFEDVSEAQLKHPFMQDLIKNANNDTFDLLLVEYIWQPYYAFKELYGVPMVGLASLPLPGSTAEALGMHNHPVALPDMLLGFDSAKTYQQRVLSWAYSRIHKLVGLFKISPFFNQQVAKYFKGVTKSVYQMSREVSLVLGNYNFANQNVRPMTAMFIPINSIHIQPEKPLPSDLATFLDGLPNDVIYFSLGTNVNPSKISQVQMDKLFKVLGRLPYTILFKHAPDNLPNNLPKNFHVDKWYPQQDLLGHPKMRLFVMQGGMQSIDEAIWKQVPMLIIPFLADQKTNAEKCFNLGIAETIVFATFEEEELEFKLQQLLSNISYQQAIQKQYKIISDEPQKPLDKAIYWIEYVLRHNGAPHLRYKGIDLPFYQNYLLDVYALVCLIILLLFYVCRKIFVIAFLSVKAAQKLIFKRTKKLKSV